MILRGMVYALPARLEEDSVLTAMSAELYL